MKKQHNGSSYLIGTTRSHRKRLKNRNESYNKIFSNLVKKIKNAREQQRSVTRVEFSHSKNNRFKTRYSQRKHEI